MSWIFGRNQPSKRAPGVADLDEAKPWTRPPSSVSGTDPAADRAAAEDRAWVDKCLRWCVAEFGEQAVRYPFALPTADFLPGGLAELTGPARESRIRDFVDRVGAVMGADTGALDVRFFTADQGRAGKRRTVGHYHRTDGRDVIELDLGHADRPAALAALIAHELGHLRLISERRLRARWSEADEEKLTDLVTVYLGMGVLTANAAHSYATSRRGFSVLPMGDLTSRMLNGAASDDGVIHLGYLTPDQFGHALARCARLRGETDPPWARHLEPGIRAVVRRTLAEGEERPGVSGR
ncbi:hypothetical protein [Kitasatospora sp. NPDC059827]|uniref:hypothetical protein n=1 Tax=Kitasatospora sp. NPDC059827 TaxID=3346964 RepID=UPI003652D37C